MRNLTIVLMAFVLMAMISCNNENSTGNKSNTNVHEVIVKEVLQANSYTYLLVDEDKQEKWIAGPKMVAAVGEKYYYQGELEMQNFESKDLGRVFEKVLFVESITDKPQAAMIPATSHMESSHMQAPHSSGRKIVPKKEGIHLVKLDDVTSVEDVYAQKEELNGKKVKVQGIVVKMNKEIMDRDWIHIQDGTGEEDNSDLTITTKNAELNIGDTVVCVGKLIKDKDFGYGYVYKVIIENGVIEVLN